MIAVRQTSGPVLEHIYNIPAQTVIRQLSLNGGNMSEYHKIQTIYKRDPETKNKNLLEGDFSLPEFKYLATNKWIFTEKVDGTNIRVIWDGETVRFGGRTDNAQIYVPLLDRLQELFDSLIMAEVFKGPIVLYGEGYGSKIQKGGGNYIPDGVDFVLFDISAGDTFLERDKVTEIANYMSLDQVPVIGEGTLYDAVEMARNGFTSTWGDFQAEGIVARPETELKDRRGSRIITKIKCRDFK